MRKRDAEGISPFGTRPADWCSVTASGTWPLPAAVPCPGERGLEPILTWLSIGTHRKQCVNWRGSQQIHLFS
jgi:hypothetical protein